MIKAKYRDPDRPDTVETLRSKHVLPFSAVPEVSGKAVEQVVRNSAAATEPNHWACGFAADEIKEADGLT